MTRESKQKVVKFCFMNTKKLPIEFNIRLKRDASKITCTQYIYIQRCFIHWFESQKKLRNTLPIEIRERERKRGNKTQINITIICSFEVYLLLCVCTIHSGTDGIARICNTLATIRFHLAEFKIVLY